ncbi:hypothetical protein [Serratia marcescens]|uniref:hypothetical protein n=1 Tax=Serratia marcescens TaxID=615 RepID=UPI000FDC35F3|nr:hypothetical protein [Serratia marcescens]
MAKEDAADKRKILTSGPIITDLHCEFLFYLLPHGEESTFQQTLFDALFSLHVNGIATGAPLNHLPFPRNSAASACATLY